WVKPHARTGRKCVGVAETERSLVDVIAVGGLRRDWTIENKSAGAGFDHPAVDNLTVDREVAGGVEPQAARRLIFPRAETTVAGQRQYLADRKNRTVGRGSAAA